MSDGEYAEIDLNYSERLLVIQHYAKLIQADCEVGNGLDTLDRHIRLMGNAARLEELVRGLGA